MKGALAAIAGLGLIAGLAVWGQRPASYPASQARPVTLPLVPIARATPGVTASPVPSSGLGHSRPPDPEALRDAPQRQAVYDAEAKPGEFVTPPSVSIEH